MVPASSVTSLLLEGEAVATADVCVVGGGLAGSSAAFVLGKAGFRVVLIDGRSTYAPCFKAEKIESDQAEMLRVLGLMEAVRPVARRIHEESTVRGGVRTGTRALEQYGVHYHDLVNAIRRKAVTAADIVIGRVAAVHATADSQRVVLSDGRTIHARLVVLACGSVGSRLHDQLALSRRMVSEHHSMSYGFSIVRTSGEAFGFDAMTCTPGRLDQPIAYLTLFAQPDGMRANLFAYQAPTDPDVRAYLSDARSELIRRMPWLVDLTGEFKLTTRVEAFPVDLSVTEGVNRAGIVLIGDAFQTVCPSTGTGLTKVFTDVDVLCRECVPKWLATAGMDASKVGEFYANARKRAVDAHSLGSALTMRRTALDRSLRFRIFRARLNTRRVLSRWFHPSVCEQQVHEATQATG